MPVVTPDFKISGLGLVFGVPFGVEAPGASGILNDFEYLYGWVAVVEGWSWGTRECLYIRPR